MAGTSILKSIRKLVCGNENYTHFDSDLIVFANSTFAIMNQVGVTENSFAITGDTEVWESYSEDPIILGMAAAYVPLKVKLSFDPPLTSSVLDALTKQAAELEWRLGIRGDAPSS